MNLVTDREWTDCCQCPLGSRTPTRVLHRFDPDPQRFTDCLFVGEGPGDMEDAFGIPFCGPAGRLLDRMIEIACSNLQRRPNLAWSNLVACKPQDRTGSRTRTPERIEVACCSTRLVDLVEALHPSMVLTLGRAPRQYMPAVLPLALRSATIIEHLVHPAAILRAGGCESPAWLDGVRTLNLLLWKSINETQRRRDFPTA